MRVLCVSGDVARIAAPDSGERLPNAAAHGIILFAVRIKAMESPKLSKIAKSPLTYIAIGVAIAAFAAWLFASERMNGIAASGPREVVVEVPVTYRNPDGT